jgi:hypothetical protein
MVEQKRSKLHVSFILTGVMLTGLFTTYAGIAITASWRAQKEMPRLAVDSLVKALRAHYQQTGRFPKDFQELETRIWRHKQLPEFGSDGRELAIANYYYIYYLVDARTSTIWIVPTGARREEGSTFFIVLTPESLRRWKGAPLTLDEIKRLSPVPQSQELAVLGLTEQSPIDLGKKK